MVALVVFYFISAPMMKSVTGSDPLTPRKIAERRAAVLDFIATVLFQRPNGKPQGASQ